MAKQILYVDDNLVMLDLIRTLLEGAGYTVLTAAEPTAALELAKGKSLSLMILDVNIGGESGLMLMNFMLHNHKEAPIILYSGGEHEQVAVKKMLELGAAKFVRKRNGAEIVTAVKAMCPLDNTHSAAKKSSSRTGKTSAKNE